MSDPTQLWLIKSSGHILGPFEQSEVIRRLRSKDLVVLDEVAKPCGRWNYIRDQIDFSKIVEEIRRGRLKGDDTTEVGAGHTQTVTLTSSIDGGRINDDLTEEIKEELIFENVDDQQGQQKREVNYDSYVFEGDRVVSDRTNETTRLLWIITILIIFGVACYVGYNQYISAPKSNKNLIAEKVDQALIELELGEYQKSLNLFKSVYEINEDQKSIYIYLGSLLIQVEEQTVLGKRLLKNVLGEGTSKRAHTGLGLASLIEGELRQADVHFDQALDIDPVYLPARINLGASALLGQNYPEANSHLHLSVKDGTKDGAAYIMLTESFIYLWKSSQEVTYLEQARKILTEYKKKFYDYGQEAEFLTLYLDSLMGIPMDRVKRFVDVLDQDPYQTSLHRQNVFIYRKATQWGRFLSWCRSMIPQTQTQITAIDKSFEAFCAIKAGDNELASKSIESAITQAPKDPIVYATYAFILKELGLNEQSSVAIGKSIEYNTADQYRLPLLLQARFCQDQLDAECSLLYWQKLLQTQPRSLPALAGVAALKLEDGDVADAKKYVYRGFRLSKDYRPFLKVIHSIQKKSEGNKNEPKGL